MSEVSQAVLYFVRVQADIISYPLCGYVYDGAVVTSHRVVVGNYGKNTLIGLLRCGYSYVRIGLFQFLIRKWGERGVLRTVLGLKENLVNLRY